MYLLGGGMACLHYQGRRVIEGLLGCGITSLVKPVDCHHPMFLPVKAFLVHQADRELFRRAGARDSLPGQVSPDDNKKSLYMGTGSSRIFRP